MVELEGFCGIEEIVVEEVSHLENFEDFSYVRALGPRFLRFAIQIHEIIVVKSWIVIVSAGSFAAYVVG